MHRIRCVHTDFTVQFLTVKQRKLLFAWHFLFHIGFWPVLTLCWRELKPALTRSSPLVGRGASWCTKKVLLPRIPFWKIWTSWMWVFCELEIKLLSSFMKCNRQSFVTFVSVNVSVMISQLRERAASPLCVVLQQKHCTVNILKSLSHPQKGEILAEADFYSTSQPHCSGNKKTSSCDKKDFVSVSSHSINSACPQVQWAWTPWIASLLESRRATSWRAAWRCGLTSSGSTCTLAPSLSSTSTTMMGKHSQNCGVQYWSFILKSHSSCFSCVCS